MSVYDLLIDVAIASILILAGQLLRAKKFLFFRNSLFRPV